MRGPYSPLAWGEEGRQPALISAPDRQMSTLPVQPAASSWAKGRVQRESGAEHLSRVCFPIRVLGGRGAGRQGTQAPPQVQQK